LLIGINLGFIFGKISKRTKRNWLKKGIQLLSAVGIAIPVFSFSMYLQYNLSYVAGAFPAIGYKTAGFDDPPFITGFRILDSIISGNGALAMDTILHYILPTIVLTVAITALMTRVFGSKFAGHSEKKKTIISITAKSSAVFSVILTYLILIDVTFNLNGFGSLFVAALYNADILVLRGLMGVIIILLVITIFVSILSFTLIGIVRDKKHPPQKDLKDTTEKEPRISGTIELKNFLKKIIRSPITIIGIVLVIIPIIVSIFPELISGYTFEEAQGIFAGAWAPASPLHPLGTSKFGRDVLAQVAYGTRNSLIFGFGAVLIGLIGGVIFGPLASKYKRVIHPIITGSMLIFYIFPGILLIMIFAIITVGGPTFGLLMFTTGFLLIPSFTRIIANSEFRIVPIIKKVLTYVPLFAGFAIILYLALGFLGFSDPLTIQLGRLVSLGREHMFDAPWASLWPGFIAFLIVISLLVLHEGLANSSR
jgi:peptide/nickel transport system permease protein